MSSDSWPATYFIRHGQTDWNKQQRFQGRRDIPLNDHGRSQAAANGVLLQRLLKQENIEPDRLDWYCSPLQRTRETMQLVRSGFATPLPDIIYDDRLKEISFGIMEGVLLSELQQALPDEYAARMKSKWHHMPPRGENYVQVVERLKTFGERLAGPCVIVSHGGIARALRHLLTGVAPRELDDWLARQDTVMRFVSGQFDVVPV